MNDMATVSPTPMSSGGSHFTAMGRRTSARQALRRPSSRTGFSRSESHPAVAAGKPIATAASSSSSGAAGNESKAKQQKQFSADSSDDEMPVPMKLSALTKAILNDDHASEAPAATAASTVISPPSQRPPSRVMTRRAAQAASSSSSISTAAAEKDARRESSSASAVRQRGGTGAGSSRHTRAGSAQMQMPPSSPVARSRETSPAPRKRIVRLSGAAATGGAPLQQPMRRSLSTSTSALQLQQQQQQQQQPRRRPESRTGDREKDRFAEVEIPLPPQQHQQQVSMVEQTCDEFVSVNTPVIRTVRIAVGSSSHKGRSDGSGSASASFDAASKRSAGLSDQEGPEEPATGNRRDASGSGSGYAAAGRKEDPGPQSSMRVKRIGKVTGSFLSGPARRGRMRQSEEGSGEGGEGGDRDLIIVGSSSGARGGDKLLSSRESGQFQDPVDVPASSFLASSYRDLASLGSPVSAKESHRVALRGHGSSSALRAASQQHQRPQHHQQQASDGAGRGHLELAYKIPAPPPEMPSTHDKENENPPTFKQPQSGISSSLLPADLAESNFHKPAKPPLSHGFGLEKGSAQQPIVISTSPIRKALAPRSQNTPHRAAPAAPASVSIVPIAPAAPAAAPPPKMSVVETVTAAAGTQATKKKQMLLRVNGRTYTRIDCIGRGGSGKVYRVSTESGKMLALKRVSLENADENTVRGFKGEISLLKRLQGVDRVIQLIDHELNMEKHVLSVLMDLGELDFNTLLKSRQSSTAEGPAAKLDPVFIRFYWKEMLECVQAVHARDVVHSDLKPANFVLVQGRLKLIDFGIANAIQTDMTVNVHRETQIGTPNYMSPESLMDSNQYAFTSAHNGKFCVPPPLQHHHNKGGMPKLMKLGKPSDVWSLGCILYQMVYGLPPFGKIANQMSRCQAIINWSYAIDFPETTEDGSRVPASILATMRRCLVRDQKDRPTCDQLLADTDPFLYPQEFDSAIFAAAAAAGADGVLPMTEELLGRIIQSVVQRCRERMPAEGEAISTWPSAYWASVKKAVKP